MNYREWKEIREKLSNYDIDDNERMNSEKMNNALEQIKSFSIENIKIEEVPSMVDNLDNPTNAVLKHEKPKKNFYEKKVIVTFSTTYAHILSEIDFKMKYKARNGDEFAVASNFMNILNKVIELLDESETIFVIEMICKRIEDLKLDWSCLAFLEKLVVSSGIDIYALDSTTSRK